MLRPRTLIFGALVFLLTQATSPAVACATNPQVALKDAVAWHGEETNKIATFRSTPQFDLPDPERFQSQVVRRLRLTEHQEAVVIYYGASEDAEVCFVVLNEEGKIASGTAGLTAGDIEVLREEWLQTMRVQGRQILRSAKPRRGMEALEVAETNRSETEVRLEMSRHLIPSELAEVVSDTDEILVLPAHSIGALPIGQLENPQGRMLVEEATISSIVSIVDLVGTRFARETGMASIQVGPLLDPAGWAPGWQRPLIVGDPINLDDPDWAFPPLPGAREEALRVAQVLNSHAIVGELATKETILQAFEKDPDFIYIAAHGIADSGNPLDGGFIALADGRLTAREVQHMRFPSRPLVVLSACQTGLGQAHPGGVVGVARAFIEAGASSVIVSLWDIDDEATADVMAEFAARVGSQRPSAALRSAMLKGKETYSHDTALWSGFISYSNIGVAQ